jgi:hypothetical protein
MAFHGVLTDQTAKLPPARAASLQSPMTEPSMGNKLAPTGKIGKFTDNGGKVSAADANKVHSSLGDILRNLRVKGLSPDALKDYLEAYQQSTEQGRKNADFRSKLKYPPPRRALAVNRFVRQGVPACALPYGGLVSTNLPQIVFDGEFWAQEFHDKGNVGVDQMLPARKFRIKCFDHADRWFKRVVGVMTAVHEGVWLGCLSADDLDAVTAKHFDESQFYASTAHSERLFRLGATTTRPLLSTRVAHPRCSRRSRPRDSRSAKDRVRRRRIRMQSATRASQEIFGQLGESKYVTYCPPDTVPSGPPVYDGLIVGWSAYTHVPTRLRRIAFLQSLRQRALPHSPLLISFFTRLPDSRDHVVYRTARLCRFFGDRELLSLGDHLEWRRYVHRFTRDEVEAEVRTAGFRIEHYNEQGGDGQAVGIAD